MKLLDVSQAMEAHADILALLEKVHRDGPTSPCILEQLSLYKELHPEIFAQVEEELVAAMGLFHKLDQPDSVYALIMKRFGLAFRTQAGAMLTPVQASVRNALDESQFVSISAPTSAGKSFAIRDYIVSGNGDVVIVVPSRALIAEYVESMRSVFSADKSVMISAFVDQVFSSRSLRRVFILTPERARDLFDPAMSLSIQLFFFDEAQISEDPERGPFFDALVRRIIRRYPSAKLAFAHPFVSNPEAQVSKHGVARGQTFARSYLAGSVGKLHLYRHENGDYYYFSPYETNGHRLSNAIKFDGDFKEFAFGGGKSTLVYVSKASLYNGSFLDEFQELVESIPDITCPAAQAIIEEVGRLVGADSSQHRSKMIELLKKGVVIHHGSVPLEVRFQLEHFVRERHAKLCFATSTLVQGVNMPFDVVWLQSMRMLGGDDMERALSLKNLIGRAGRMTTAPKFDYGYVFCEQPRSLAEKLDKEFELSQISALERDDAVLRPDLAESLDAIRTNTYVEHLNIPLSRAERLSSDIVQESVRALLGLFYGSAPIAEAIGGDSNRQVRKQVLTHFRQIYESAIGRVLLEGEGAVFKEAIKIMLLSFQGRSFKEIVGIRYAGISNRNGRGRGPAIFSQRAGQLPDVRLVRPFALYPSEVPASKVGYDTVVFDTYDYLDKVISFSLADAFVAAFKIYLDLHPASPADRMIEIIRFGTNDPKAIMLLRYGFSPELIDEIYPLVYSVNEQSIVFNEIPRGTAPSVRSAIDWYL